MWVDNFKTDLRALGFSGMDWIDLAQDRNSLLGSVSRNCTF
jgi:hypothetical protein